jgi:trk system potassium uptake protein TrkH
MNYRGVLFLLGRLLLGLGAALLVPAGVAVYFGGAEAKAFFLAAAIAGVLGVVVERRFRHGLSSSFGRREAFMLVSAAWVMASVVGALPYVLIKGPGFIVDGLFESVSGFTTTGASILDNVEAESEALLLWRSLTQWFGGMGIIVLGIAVLPKLAIGGMQLLGAEAPGPVTEKLTPRIAQTAKALWGIYALLTAVLFGVLTSLGMRPLDAVNHALTTMATGGFSTRNASVGEYSNAIEIVITVFMVLAGVNFALHFNLLRGRPLKMLKDPELRLYVGLIAVAALLLAANLLFHGEQTDFLAALRLGAFQSATIVTTTGFATADFDAWPEFSRALLFLLMFVGGCAGSTGGSVKVVRILILFKKFGVEFKRFIQPHGVFPVRVGQRAIPDDVVGQITTFFLLFMALFAGGALLLGMTGLDPVSAFAASATCLGNIGPGFADVGPTHTMSQLPTVAKLILGALMIIGRLELYTVLVTLYLCRKLF